LWLLHYGIPFVDRTGVHRARAALTVEILRTFSFPKVVIGKLSKHPFAYQALENIAGIPFRSASAFARRIFDSGVFPFPDDQPKNSENVVNCFAYTSKPVPTADTWNRAYTDDPETQFIMSRLQNDAKHKWSKKELAAVDAQFRDHLRTSSVEIAMGRLVLYLTLASEGQRLMLIVVPKSLRRDIFAAYHAAPTAGHMGPYKTLHRIRLRFFWPKVRTDVFDWCQQCAHCIATSNSIRRHSELMFSWPVSTPFFILHIDLWQPGKTEEKFSGSTHLLAAMCDLSGFVICHPVKDTTSGSLARIFMEEVLLKVGLCGLVVVDAASVFFSVFKEMCDVLGLRFHQAARGNHKAVSVERFFRYLNKAVAIAANDRNTNQVFIETSHCAAYAWNSSCIDGTDIVRSVVAVGREFKFPLDITLHETPTPVHGSVSAVHSFLRLAQENSQFATNIAADHRRKTLLSSRKNKQSKESAAF
jgi:hypothetical protein